MHGVTIGVFCLWMVACASASSKGGEGGAQGQPDTATHVMTAAPTTITVQLDDDTRQNLERHLAAGSLLVARLTIKDVRPRAAQALKGVHVYVEKLDATASTPADDPHAAGNFVLGFTPSESLFLNVAPALSRLWASGAVTKAELDKTKALRITLVPEPWDFAAKLPADFALTMQSVTLEVPRQP